MSCLFPFKAKSKVLPKTSNTPISENIPPGPPVVLVVPFVPQTQLPNNEVLDQQKSVSCSELDRLCRGHPGHTPQKPNTGLFSGFHVRFHTMTPIPRQIAGSQLGQALKLVARGGGTQTVFSRIYLQPQCGLLQAGCLKGTQQEPRKTQRFVPLSFPVSVNRKAVFASCKAQAGQRPICRGCRFLGPLNQNGHSLVPSKSVETDLSILRIGSTWVRDLNAESVC